MKLMPAEILREYGPFPGVRNVAGVSFDGRRIWFASGDKLNVLDPGSGETAGKFDVTADAGTAFDGTHLYQIAEAVIRKIDPATGDILATIPAPGNGGDSGLAWADGSLWVGQHRGHKIHQIEPETGKIMRTIESNRFVTGVTWVDGEFWHGTWQDNESDVRRIDPETGEVLVSLDMPPGFGVSGLESDGGDRFFCGGGDSGKISGDPSTSECRHNHLTPGRSRSFFTRRERIPSSSRCRIKSRLSTSACCRGNRCASCSPMTPVPARRS